MKTFLDCVPCIMRQAVEAPRRFTSDEGIRERIVRKMAASVAEFDPTRTPPEMGAALNRIMSEELGDPDPYLSEKRRFNELALGLLPSLRRKVEDSPDPFEAATRIVMAGNIIDFGAPGGDVTGDLESRFDHALEASLFEAEDGLLDRFHAAADGASKILYLADNAGEIVVDNLLIGRLPAGSVTVAVRSGPAINDALEEDARVAGLHRIATIVESGAAIPGTPLAMVSDEFRALFDEADLIISKGQGNFETLSDEDAPMVFLLMAKCHVVAGHLGCRVGDYVITASRGF